MSRLVGESHGARALRVVALAAAAAVAIAGCASSRSSGGSERLASGKAFTMELAELQFLGNGCLNLPLDKIYKERHLSHGTTEMEYQDGKVPPNKDQRTCTVTTREIHGSPVVTSASFDTAQGVRSTLAATLTDGGRHISAITSTTDPSANGGSLISSIVTHTSTTLGAVYGPVEHAALTQLDGATPVPAGA